MKARLFFFIAITCLLGLAAMAQSSNVPEPNFALTSFAARGPGLHLFDNVALADDQRFALPPDTPGESSSRKHSDNANPNGPAAAADQTVPVQGASTEPCVQQRTPWFSIRLKMTTAPAGRKNCPLDAGQKFVLFTRVTTSPYTFAAAGAAAGWSQWQNDDSEWGQGAKGYGQRYAAAYADRATKSFFNKFFYPVIFRQDPRYFRKGSSFTTGERLGHAIGNTFVGHSDSGNRMPNLSLWAGTASTVAVENLYHPGHDRGFTPAAKRFGISIGTSMGFDVAREFFPEIARALHLPGRERRVAPVGTIAKP